MNYEEASGIGGLIKEYRSDLVGFYRPYFDNEDDLNRILSSAFDDDSKDKRPRWMLNDIYRFVTLANDIEKIRPGRDPLRILFFRICLEALSTDSETNNKTFFESFDSYFSEEGKHYILDNFRFTGLYYPENIDKTECCYYDYFENYQLTCADFLSIIRATRNMVTHDGDYWSMQFWARDTESVWTTCITTKDEIVACQPKGTLLTYSFQTTMQYDRFEYYFVQACLNFVKKYLEVM